jgi:RNA polymerase-binding transcription factor DksA
MDIGALLLLIALLLGVSLYLAAPLMNNHSTNVLQGTQEVSSLMAERDRIINALQELDFDFKLGKIPEEDYPVQRAELLHTGANVLKKLDHLTANLSSSDELPQKSQKNLTAESRLEQAAATHQADGSNRVTDKRSGNITDDEIESMLATRRKARKANSAGFCPRCGKPVLTSDLFCPNCGKALR